MNSSPQTWWDRNGTGDFLSCLRHTSAARKWCRWFIRQKAREIDGVSIGEVGFGGCNERIAMDGFLRETNTYCGYDIAQLFVDYAKVLYPQNKWVKLDIQSGPLPRQFDIVYSQHVIEHCGGLNPAFSNMLRSASRFCIVIFFIPPLDSPDVVNFVQYPLYHNRYQIQHIQKVCEAESFKAMFLQFENPGHINDNCPEFETVLVCEKTEADLTS